VTPASDRPPARKAGSELLVLARFEEFTAWLFERTQSWPKSARFTLTQRIENHALDALEDLVVARYARAERAGRLEAVNLRLERMRHLLRISRHARACPASTFESALRFLEEIGRMLYGWRSSLRSGGTPCDE
jgi:hypothetical protein